MNLLPSSRLRAAIVPQARAWEPLGSLSLGTCQRTEDSGGAPPFGANLVPKHPDTP